MLTKVIAIALAILLNSGYVISATYRVGAGEGSDALNIQAGLDMAAIGDTVVVMSGIYQHHANPSYCFSMKSGVVLISESSDPEMVVVDALGIGSACYGWGLDSGTVISGITFAGGHATEYPAAGGISIGFNHNVRIENCIVRDNQSDQGCGGILVNRGVAQIINCTVSNNIGSTTGGIRLSECTEYLISGCTVSDNGVTLGGVGGLLVQSSVGELESSIFSGNNGGNAGGAYVYSFPTVASAYVSGCIFFNNTATDMTGAGGGMLYKTNSTGSVDNCVFVANNHAIPDYAAGLNSMGSALEHVHNTIFAFNHGIGCSVNFSLLRDVVLFENIGDDLNYPFGSNGIISVNPGICDWENNDFHLCSDSVCLPGVFPGGHSHGLIGVYGAGCGSCGPFVSSEKNSWGEVKAIYR